MDKSVCKPPWELFIVQLNQMMDDLADYNLTANQHSYIVAPLIQSRNNMMLQLTQKETANG